MTDTEDDATLVARAAARGIPGQLAFEALVDRHQRWLVRFLLHLLGGSRGDAEDIAQEALIRAFLAIDRCGEGAQFRAWLRVIALRLAFNQRRDAKTRSRYEERSGELQPLHSAPPSAVIDERDALERILGALAYPYREIMVLRFVEELSLKEIAAVLEIGESAAKMRLSRARAEFQRLYQAKGGGR